MEFKILKNSTKQYVELQTKQSSFAYFKRNRVLPELQAENYDTNTHSKTKSKEELVFEIIRKKNIFNSF